MPPQFRLFVGDVQKMYGDQDWRPNGPRKLYYDILQGYHNANDNVPAYANRLWPNWRDAECDEMQFQLILYDML